MEKKKINLISISILLIIISTFNSFSTNIPSNGSGASGYSNQYESGGGSWAISPTSLRAPMSVFELYDQNGQPGQFKSKILVCQSPEAAELLAQKTFTGLSSPYANNPAAESLKISKDNIDNLFKDMQMEASGSTNLNDKYKELKLSNASYTITKWRAVMTYTVNLPEGVTVLYTDKPATMPCYTDGMASYNVLFHKAFMPYPRKNWEDWVNAWLRGDTTEFHEFFSSLKNPDKTSNDSFIKSLDANSPSDFITLTPDSTGGGNTNPQGKFAVKDSTNNTCPIILFKTVDMYIDTSGITKKFKIGTTDIEYYYSSNPVTLHFSTEPNKPLVSSNREDPNPFIKTMLNKVVAGIYNPVSCGSLVAWMTGSDGGGGGGGGGETTPTTPTIKPPDPSVEYADEMILFEDELQYNYSLFDGNIIIYIL